MAPGKRAEQPAIDEDFSYQGKAWALQRLAWGAFGLVLVAALAGLFGKGGISHQSKTSPDGSIFMEYERFLHTGSQDSLELRVRHSGQQDRLEVWITRSYMASMMVAQIIPQPEAVRAEDDRLVYVFLVPRTNSSIWIEFCLEPQKAGSLPGTIGVGTSAALRFEQFVYP